MMNHHPETTRFYRSKLPHWEVMDGHYFVTICQHDAIPPKVADRIHRMSSALKSLKGGDLLELQRKIFREMEEWLDKPHPSGLLIRPEIVTIITDAIAYRNVNQIWRIHEYVIMPTHLHLFLQVLRGGLRESLIAFKKWCAHQAMEQSLLPDNDLWHREWFDHWSRSPEEDERIKNYIRNNPVKAGLAKCYKDWPSGSWK